MIVRSTLFLLSGLAALPTTFTQDIYPSPKRGLVYVPNNQHPTDDNIWDHAGSDLTWYYTYGATPAPAFRGTQLQFVPMLWGAPAGGSSDTTFLSQVEGLIQNGLNISYVLTFNEPDGGSSTGGSNVAPSYAAQIWATNVEPLKQKYGIKLGAPAVTGAPSGFDWMQQFFGNCSGNCSVDFIPIHWYDNYEGLVSHVGQYHDAYPNATIWVTEYADANDSLGGTEAFFNQTASWFDGLDYLTHYSYFGSFRSSASNVGPNVAMLDNNGKLTNIGSWYLGNVPVGTSASAASSISVSAGWTLLVGLVCLLVMR